MSSNFIANQPYVGTIVGQGFIQKKDNTLSFVLDVRIDGKSTNPSDLTQFTPHEKYEEAQVWITFPSEKEKLQWRVNDLERLGWLGEDLRELDPSTEDYHSFTDKVVLIAPTIKPQDDGSEKIFWNLTAPAKKRKALESNGMKLLDKLSEKYTKAKAYRNKNSSKGSSGNNTFDVDELEEETTPV